MGGELKAGKPEGHGTYTASNERKLNGIYTFNDLEKEAERLGKPSSPSKVEKPPQDGAVFVQGETGTLYLMEAQNRRREVHQIILQRMPEEGINAGYISPDGDINQTSGKVNQRNFGERSLNDKLGLICAERVQFHYEKGNIMWVSKDL